MQTFVLITRKNILEFLEKEAAKKLADEKKISRFYS